MMQVLYRFGFTPFKYKYKRLLFFYHIPSVYLWYYCMINVMDACQALSYARYCCKVR